MAQQKICLFGGTFDPIHLGHTYIASRALKVISLDKVIFLPCRQSPHKSKQNQASDQERLDMCRLATSQLPWAEVSTYDLDAPAPSYSWRTAEAFRSSYPDAELYWLMGVDQWNHFDAWQRPKHLASLVKFLVFYRDRPPRQYNQFAQQTIRGNHPASATAIRQSNPRRDNLRNQWLHKPVRTYIREQSLYNRYLLKYI